MKTLRELKLDTRELRKQKLDKSLSSILTTIEKMGQLLAEKIAFSGYVGLNIPLDIPFATDKEIKDIHTQIINSEIYLDFLDNMGVNEDEIDVTCHRHLSNVLVVMFDNSGNADREYAIHHSKSIIFLQEIKKIFEEAYELDELPKNNEERARN